MDSTGRPWRRSHHRPSSRTSACRTAPPPPPRLHRGSPRRRAAASRRSCNVRALMMANASANRRCNIASIAAPERASRGRSRRYAPTSRAPSCTGSASPSSSRFACRPRRLRRTCPGRLAPPQSSQRYRNRRDPPLQEDAVLALRRRLQDRHVDVAHRDSDGHRDDRMTGLARRGGEQLGVTPGSEPPGTR